MDSIRVAADALLEDMKDQVGHWRKSVWSLRVDTNVMAHNQSISRS